MSKPARANEAPAPTTAADASQAAATAYRQALELHGRGELKAALTAMQESYRLSGRAELIYNIARLEAELGDCSASLIHYREYLHKVPDGRYRLPAEQASTELAQRCPEQRSTSAAPVASPSRLNVVAPASTATDAPAMPATVAAESARHPRAEGGSPWPPRWLGWSAIAAGALAGTGAVYFTLAAADARDQFERSVKTQLEGGKLADFQLQYEQHRHQRWARVLAVTSGALLASGAVIVIWAPTERSLDASADIYVQPGLVGARFSRRF